MTTVARVARQLGLQGLLPPADGLKGGKSKFEKESEHWLTPGGPHASFTIRSNERLQVGRKEGERSTRAMPTFGR